MPLPIFGIIGLFAAKIGSYVSAAVGSAAAATSSAFATATGSAVAAVGTAIPSIVVGMAAFNLISISGLALLPELQDDPAKVEVSNF